MHNMFNERSDADGGDSFLLRVFDSTVTRREVLSYGMGAARVELSEAGFGHVETLDGRAGP